MEYLHVPYGKTVHGEEEIEAVVEVLRTSTQMGPKTTEFEAKVAKLYDKKYGVMVNSGSSALYLVMETLDLPKGSEVITPACTFSTTVACLLNSDLIPVFADVEESTYCINPNQIEELITENTKAVLIPDLLGNIARWQDIYDICKKHDLIIIEDSADTLGGTLNGKSSGAWADVCITSFYGSHVINCAGNGGMACFNDEEHYKRARLLRSWGRSSSLFNEKDSEALENRFNVDLDGIEYDAKFVFEVPGYQWEGSEMGAAFGLVQLNKLQNNIDARTNNYNAQYEFFKQYENYFIMPKQTPNSRTGWLAFPLVVKDDAPFTRREMMTFLESRNIQTRVVMCGNVLRQPMMKGANYKAPLSQYPIADNVMRGGMLLACHHGLEQQHLDHIHNSFKEFIGKY